MHNADGGLKPFLRRAFSQSGLLVPAENGLLMAFFLFHERVPVLVADAEKWVWYLDYTGKSLTIMHIFRRHLRRIVTAFALFALFPVKRAQYHTAC